MITTIIHGKVNERKKFVFTSKLCWQHWRMAHM